MLLTELQQNLRQKLDIWTQHTQCLVNHLNEIRGMFLESAALDELVVRLAVSEAENDLGLGFQGKESTTRAGKVRKERELLDMYTSMHIHVVTANNNNSHLTRDSLDKQFGPDNFFIILLPSNLLPAVNDVGDGGVTHISNHDGKRCLFVCVERRRKKGSGGMQDFDVDCLMLVKVME